MSERVALLLDDLEAALKATALWQAQAPSAQALASSAPFCCDTMPLENWLQFVFIPKMRQILAAAGRLPHKIQILPMAEHVYANKLSEVASLLAVIKRLDTCLT